jgi:hypothetical protein
VFYKNDEAIVLLESCVQLDLAASEDFMTGRVALAILTLAFLGGYQQLKPLSSGMFNGFDLVDKTGNINRLDPKGDQMHMTYASPGAAEYHRQNRSSPTAPSWSRKYSEQTTRK